MQTLISHTMDGTWVLSIHIFFCSQLAPLRQLCPEAVDNLEFVEADLTEKKGWSAALNGGIQEVYHLASPFFLEPPDNEMEVIEPAVSGTMNVLTACLDSGSVRKVVLTSSCVAIWNQVQSNQYIGVGTVCGALCYVYVCLYRVDNFICLSTCT